MKGYTDLEQSKVLSEILPLESADMEFMFLKKDNSMVSEVPFIKDGHEEPDCPYNMVPSWSLAALLDIIPEGQVDRMMSNGKWMALSWPLGHYYIEKDYDAAVDACYALILRLHEEKIL